VRCPFLREEQVKSCQVAPYRKSLARSFASGSGERCTSAAYTTCPALCESHEAHPDVSRCPFLRESLVQFCAASSRPTYVPWSASPDLRCAHDGHRYCELFLGVAGAAARGPALPTGAPEERSTPEVDGIPVPAWLFYADNHMWLDVGDDGLCHLGVDAFLARLAGEVDGLAFLTLKGEVAPAVVLTIGGADLTLVFGRPLPLVAANTRLRSSPDRLVSDPYGVGWLFSARWDEPRGTPGGPAAGVGRPRHGRAARDWMAAEVARLSLFVHEQLLRERSGAALPADGGHPAPGLLRHLEREDVLRLFAAFFPLPTATRRNV
jgi:glycine cleavage system H lipoate-binding protein